MTNRAGLRARQKRNKARCAWGTIIRQQVFSIPEDELMLHAADPEGMWVTPGQARRIAWLNKRTRFLYEKRERALQEVFGSR